MIVCKMHFVHVLLSIYPMVDKAGSIKAVILFLAAYVHPAVLQGAACQLRLVAVIGAEPSHKRRHAGRAAFAGDVFFPPEFKRNVLSSQLSFPHVPYRLRMQWILAAFLGNSVFRKKNLCLCINVMLQAGKVCFLQKESNSCELEQNTIDVQHK